MVTQSGLINDSPTVDTAPWNSNKVSNAGGQRRGNAVASAATCM